MCKTEHYWHSVADICISYLPSEFATAICRGNLPHIFAVAFCRVDLPWEPSKHLDVVSTLSFG